MVAPTWLLMSSPMMGRPCSSKRRIVADLAILDVEGGDELDVADVVTAEG